MDDFYEKLAEMLEVETVRPEDILRDFATWDSLTALSVIVLLDTEYNCSFNPLDFAHILTAGDLKAWVEARK